MDKEKLSKIVLRCQEGDPSAQEELVLETQDAVYYQCKKMLKNKHDAEDATQEILIAMLGGLNSLKEPDAFWGWLHRIIANRCKNALTRGSHDLPIIKDEEGHSLLDSLEELDEQIVPDKALDSSETQRMITELVDALPPEQRSCVLMYYYSELSVKEIADATETAEGTVKSRLNYARKSIKEGVENYERQGIKLYGASPVSFLLYFLRKDAAVVGLSEAAKQSITSAVLSGVQVAASAADTVVSAADTAVSVAEGAATAATAAKSSGAFSAGAAVLHTAVKGISTKVIAAIVAGGVAIGGVSAATSHAVTKNDMQKEIDAARQEQVVTEEALAEIEEELVIQQEAYEADLAAAEAELAAVEAEIPSSVDDTFALLDEYIAEEVAAHEYEWVNTVLEKAETLANAGKYSWAQRLVKNGLEHYPENAELLAAQKRYQSDAPVWLFSMKYTGNMNALTPISTPITTADGTVHADRSVTIKSHDNAYIRYSLNGEYTRLTGLTYLTNYDHGGYTSGSGESLRFRIIADGVHIYDYDFAPYSTGQSDSFDLDVSGVQVLAIQFYGLNDNLDAAIFEAANGASGNLGLIDFMLQR